MNPPNASQTTPSSAGTAPNSSAKSVVIVGTLAALFGGGMLLLYALTGGGVDLPLAQQVEQAEQENAAEPTAGSQQIAAPTATAVTSAELNALESQLTEARARIDQLMEQTAAFADTPARLDALDAEVAAAKAAADAAAAQAAQVAQRWTNLTADYAKLGARFTPAGVLIRLDETTLAFPPGSAALPQDADTALTQIAAFLQSHPAQQALLRGHTDATGSAATNLDLSEQRAAAVRAALIELGVPAERLRIEGVGAAEPIADNASAGGRGRNRRVDVLLSESDSAPDTAI